MLIHSNWKKPINSIPLFLTVLPWNRFQRTNSHINLKWVWWKHDLAVGHVERKKKESIKLSYDIGMIEQDSTIFFFYIYYNTFILSFLRLVVATLQFIHTHTHTNIFLRFSLASGNLHSSISFFIIVFRYEKDRFFFVCASIAFIAHCVKLKSNYDLRKAELLLETYTICSMFNVQTSIEISSSVCNGWNVP